MLGTEEVEATRALLPILYPLGRNSLKPVLCHQELEESATDTPKYLWDLEQNSSQENTCPFKSQLQPPTWPAPSHILFLFQPEVSPPAIG